MSLLMVLLHRQGQPNCDYHTLVNAVTGCLNGPVIGSYESAGDPESQSEARSHLRVTITTKELLSKQSSVIGVKAGALVSDGNHELSRFKMAAYVDGRFRRRIFRRVVENLSQRLLHQDRVYAQENEFLRKRHLDGAAREAVAAALKRRIDEVGGFRPFELRLQAVAADPRSVENILDFDIEPLRFLLDQRGKLFQAGISGNFRRQ